MKIKEKITDREDGTSCIEIYINDKRVFVVYDIVLYFSIINNGEIEDNNLCRNFNDCYGIVELLKEAHEAGKRGEVLEIE